MRFMESQSNETPSPNQHLPGNPPPSNGVRVVHSNFEVHVGDVIVFDQYSMLVNILHSVFKILQLITHFIKNQNNSKNPGFINGSFDQIIAIYTEILRCDSLFEPHDLLPISEVIFIFHW